MRGVDVGGKHLAATIDLDGNTEIYDIPHKRILRDIDALKGLRDRRSKGKHAWRKLDGRIRRLRERAGGLADNVINQAVNSICTGADVVGIEHLDIKSMTAHGGNHKRRMNRSMRENQAGKFLRKLGQKSDERGLRLEDVPAPYTSQTCSLCGHIDPESRVSRGRFVCTNCNREFHADLNAAGNVLHRAAGKVVQRRLEQGRGNKPTSRRFQSEAPEKGVSDTGWCHLCI